jgi:predicted nucleotidyltransferase component of viral defense system
MATLIQSLENILSKKDALLSNETKRIVLKEVLQAYTLNFLYNHSTYRRLNFYGGTCLHLIYGLNRLSEDIDLDNSAEIDIFSLEEDLLTYYRSNIGYPDLTTKSQQGEWGVHRITLKFPILNSLGLSPYPNEALHLKVEISQHKQTAIILKTPLLTFGQSLVASHFSLETMMAGKMIACLERNFQKGNAATRIKGRDFYDLLWFMQQKIQPLEEKLEKDGKQPYSLASAMRLLSEKVAAIKTSDLAVDLLPLFEQRSFIEVWLESFHQNFERFTSYYLPS